MSAIFAKLDASFAKRLRKTKNSFIFLRLSSTGLA